MKAGNYICVSVVDSGVGMDAATLKRAVEPFFSTKGVGKGTGLGLSMVHGLAAQSGGALLLSSKPGSGTRAELWLPVAEEKAAASEQTQAEAIPAAYPSTVLLVDDEELVRIGTAEILMDLGYSVVQASSVPRRSGFVRDEFEIDLLVSDYLMPGIDGASFVREARKLDLAFRPFSHRYTNLVQGPGAELPAGKAVPAGRTRFPHRRARRDRTIARQRDTTAGCRAPSSELGRIASFRHSEIQRKSACPKTAL